MAGILLDVDGVLHVTDSSIAGAADAVEQLREKGHRLRFVTNNTTHSRRQLAEQIRGFGVELEDGELQTTPTAAAHALKGKRVLALTMPDIVEDLGEIELVGEGADAVLIGGADETFETNQVFSYMNLARAFAELQGGAELYCLHKNRWGQRGAGPPSSAYTRTVCGRRRAARCSPRAGSPPGSSTRPSSRTGSSASRVPRT